MLKKPRSRGVDVAVLDPHPRFAAALSHWELTVSHIFFLDTEERPKSLQRRPNPLLSKEGIRPSRGSTLSHTPRVRHRFGTADNRRHRRRKTVRSLPRLC